MTWADQAAPKVAEVIRRVGRSDRRALRKALAVYNFGILSSTMHNTWMRSVCGRLKSDYRYSVGIVYNNYPWPTQLSPALQQAIEDAAESVLQARALYGDSCLADLYDPLTMPPS